MLSRIAHIGADCQGGCANLGFIAQMQNYPNLAILVVFRLSSIGWGMFLLRSSCTTSLYRRERSSYRSWARVMYRTSMLTPMFVGFMLIAGVAENACRAWLWATRFHSCS